MAKTARLIAVRPHIRTAPVAHPEFDSEVHKELRQAFAIQVMQREIERVVEAEIAIEAGGLR